MARPREALRPEIASALAGRLGGKGVDGDLVSPASVEEVAAVCALATERGWRLRITGAGTWEADGAPADVTLGTRRLARVASVAPEDLVATVEAGVTLGQLAAGLAPSGLWLPVDPPGGANRTIGSVVATATAGPLRHGFGPVRDQVLGCTVVTADGRAVASGGRVVKNVAGFDLPKLHTGGFGAFGVITQVHLRLRARPERDVTVLATGERTRLAAAAATAWTSGAALSALELVSPTAAGTGQWHLAARLTGTDAGTLGELRRLRAAMGLDLEELEESVAAQWWERAGSAAGPISLRLGCRPGDLEPVMTLVESRLGQAAMSAGAGTGQVRWTGDTAAEPLASLRRELADRGIPLVLERAPWTLRRQIGHTGALPDGVGALVARLRALFDPRGVLAVALEADRG